MALLHHRVRARDDGKARIEQRLAELHPDELRDSAALKPALHARRALSS